MAAPVQWDFIATGCALGGCAPGQAYPVTLATFTLPGPDSSGSAHFSGGFGPATYTGDSFILDYSLNHYRPLTPAFLQSGGQNGECVGSPVEICQFDLSWSETAGQLDGLHFYVNMFNDSFLGTLGDATVASDNIYISGAFAGCEGPPCRIAGEWIDSPATVPEPGTLAMMLAGFAGFAGMRRRALAWCKPE